MCLGRSVAPAFALCACSLSDAGTGVPEAGEQADVAALTDAGHQVDAADVGVSDVTMESEASSPTNYALDFGAGAYVSIGAFPIPSDFTIEAWIKPASTSNETYIVAEDRDTQGMGQFRFGITSGALFFMMTDAQGSSHGLYSGGYSLMTTPTIATGSWTHVAVSKSGTAFELVVNGSSAATFASTAPTITYGGPPVAFRIAARVASDGTSANGTFDGTIDEVRVWNGALSATNIAATMSTEIPPATAGLVGYWRFDDGVGSTTADQEVAHPGTLVGGPTWVVSTAF